MYSWIILHGAKLIKDAFNEPAFTARTKKEAVKFISGDADGMSSAFSRFYYIEEFDFESNSKDEAFRTHCLPIHPQESLVRREGFGPNKEDLPSAICEISALVKIQWKL